LQQQGVVRNPHSSKFLLLNSTVQNFLHPATLRTTQALFEAEEERERLAHYEASGQAKRDREKAHQEALVQADMGAIEGDMSSSLSSMEGTDTQTGEHSSDV
jgi:hypothetical protein